MATLHNKNLFYFLDQSQRRVIDERLAEAGADKGTTGNRLEVLGRTAAISELFFLLLLLLSHCWKRMTSIINKLTLRKNAHVLAYFR